MLADAVFREWASEEIKPSEQRRSLGRVAWDMTQGDSVLYPMVRESLIKYREPEYSDLPSEEIDLRLPPRNRWRWD